LTEIQVWGQMTTRTKTSGLEARITLALRNSTLEIDSPWQSPSGIGWRF